MDIRPLCYGDEIRLILGPEGGFMGAEGVLDSECRLLRSDIPRMDRAIFRIIIPYQYSAAKELKEYIADRLAEGLDAESDPEDSQLRALTRGKLNEDKQNETAVQQRICEPVQFGDTIQLQHVLSSKFITVNTSETAQVERENLQVCLDEEGSVFSHLKIVARLKIDEEIGAVMNNTEVYLKARATTVGDSEREQYIHASKDIFHFPSIAFSNKVPGVKSNHKDSETKEINCSLEKSTWKLSIYDAAEVGDKSHLRAGDVVYFHDPDSQMTLMLHDPHTMSRAEGMNHDHHSFASFFKSHMVDISNETDSNAYFVVEKESLDSGGPVVVGGEEPFPGYKLRHLNSGRYLYKNDGHRLQKLASKIFVSGMLSRPTSSSAAAAALTQNTTANPTDVVNSLNTQESMNINNVSSRASSPGKLENSPLRVKSKNDDGVFSNEARGSHSKDYDAPGGDDENDERNDHTDPRLMFSDDVPRLIGCVRDAQSLSSVFRLSVHRATGAGHAERSRLATNVAVHIQSDGHWLKIAKVPDLTKMKESELASMHAKRELELEKGDAIDNDDGTSTVVGVLQEDSSRVPCISVLSSDEALPFVIKRVPDNDCLEARVGCAAYPYFTSFNQALKDSKEKQITNQHDLFIAVINRMVNFVCGKDMTVIENVEYETNRPLPSRQRLMREQGILGVSMDILHFLLDPERLTGGRQDIANRKRFAASVIRVRRSVSRALFQLLFYSIRKNSDIQRFTAKRLSVFVTHSEHESVATRCIVEMLQENLELQEAEVSEREVQVFVNMLRRNPMHPLFLNLLKATCECSGTGVDQNQQIVANVMMVENRGLLVKIGPPKNTPNFSGGGGKQPLKKQGSFVVMSRTTTPDAAHQTNSVACDGLYASWSVEGCPEFSPKVLYGKDEVPLVELFEIYHNPKVKGLKRTKSMGSQYAMVRVTDAERAAAAIASPKNKAGKVPLKGNSTPSPFSKTRASFKAALGAITHAAAAAKKQPKTCEFDLTKKLGMGITSSAIVGSVIEKGQAEAGGIRPGAKIIAVGESIVISLDGIKKAVGDAQLNGLTKVTIKYEPPSSSISGVTRTLSAIKTVNAKKPRTSKRKSKAESALEGSGGGDSSPSSPASSRPTTSTSPPTSSPTDTTSLSTKETNTNKPQPPPTTMSSSSISSKNIEMDNFLNDIDAEIKEDIPKKDDDNTFDDIQPVNEEVSKEATWVAMAAAGTLKTRLQDAHAPAIVRPKTPLEKLKFDAQIAQIAQEKKEREQRHEQHRQKMEQKGTHHHHHHHHKSDGSKPTSPNRERAERHQMPSIEEMRRKIVADYVIRQLYLLGSMCLGRNYVSMKLIQKDFPYEHLVSIITDERMPNGFRSGAVYLINCLYVDSNPQMEMLIPNLIRNWSGVVKDMPVSLPGAAKVMNNLAHHSTDASSSSGPGPGVADPGKDFPSNGIVEMVPSNSKEGKGSAGGSFDNNHPSMIGVATMGIASKFIGNGTITGEGGGGKSMMDERNHNFKELKGVIVCHLNTLTRLSGDDLTLQLMSLLQKLMTFRFYTSAGQMQSVVQPILRTLDDRSFSAQPKDRNARGRPNASAKVPGGGGAVAAANGSFNSGSRPGTASRPGSPTDFGFGVANSIDNEGNVAKKKAKSNANLPDAEGRVPRSVQMKKNIIRFFNDMGLPVDQPKKLLAKLESIKVMIVILFIVLGSVALAVYQTFNGIDTKNAPVWMLTIDYTVSGLFGIDISIRVWCWMAWHNYTFGSFFTFWDLYRGVDGGCVLLDILALAVASVFKGINAASKLLKLLRLVRLVRLVRAGNILFEIMNALKGDDVDLFELPRRYEFTPRAELRMMANVVDVLTHVTHVAQDYRLSRLLQAFRAYTDLKKSKARTTMFDGFVITSKTKPAELFEFVVTSSEKGNNSLALGTSGEISYIMLNLCLYNYPPLVQASLSLLMDSNKSRTNLLRDLKQLQLLTTPQQEELVDSLQSKLMRLRSHAETYELWLERRTDKDRKIALEMFTYLKDLVKFCESQGTGLPLPLDHDSDTGNRKAQLLLQHLDGAKVMTQIFREILPSLKDFIDAQSEAKEAGDEDEAEHFKLLYDSTKEILRLCNRLICGYVRGNLTNQLQVHKHLQLFVKSIDKDVHSVLVISEIFRGNDELISRFDKGFVAEVADQIAISNQNPDFMRVLGAVAQIGSTPHPELQSHILRELTQPGREDAVMVLCTDPTSRSYAARKEMCQKAIATSKMIPDSKKNAGMLDHLPPQLAYHVTLVNLLAACASGSKNVNIVEAKLQSIYPLDHLVTALIDSSLCVEVQLGLLRYLRQAFIDAEMKFAGLSSHKLLWLWFARVPEFLKASYDDIAKFNRAYSESKSGYGGFSLNHQSNAQEEVLKSWGYDERMRLEFAYETLVVTRLFFGQYFKLSQVPVRQILADKEHQDSLPVSLTNSPNKAPNSSTNNVLGGKGTLSGASPKNKMVRLREFNSFESSSSSSSSSEDETENDGMFTHQKTTQLKHHGNMKAAEGVEDDAVSEWVTNLLRLVLYSVRDLFEIGGPYVTDGFLVECTDAADAIVNSDNNYFLPNEVYAIGNPETWKRPPGISQLDLSNFRKNRVSHRKLWKSGGCGSDSLTGEPASASFPSSIREVGLFQDDDEILNQLSSFIKSLENDETLKAKIESDMFSVVSEIQNLPEIKEAPEKGDLRREYLVQRLVKHVYASMQYGTVLGTKRLDPACTSTTKWMMQFCRNMIESKWGMGIDERDEDGGAEEDKMAQSTQLLLNNWGVTALCVDLVAAGIADDVKIEAIKLLIALLFKEGGNERVQETIHDHLEKMDSSAFFVEVKRMFTDLIEWHQANHDGNSKEGKNELPDDIIIIKCLQLCCEGHFKPNQDILRTQDAPPVTRVKGQLKIAISNESPENLLDQMVEYLNVVSKIPHRVASKAANRVAALVLEVLQGPCDANQLYFSRKTDLLEILNRMMRSRVKNDQREAEEKQLKLTVVKIFQALLEGRSSTDELYKKIVGIVHLDVLISHVELPVLKVLAEAGDLGDELFGGANSALLDPGDGGGGGKSNDKQKSGFSKRGSDRSSLTRELSLQSSSPTKSRARNSRGGNVLGSPGGPVGSTDNESNTHSMEKIKTGGMLTKMKSFTLGGTAQVGVIDDENDYDANNEYDNGEEDDEDALEEVKENLQTQILVLLRMFKDYDPRLKHDKMMMRLEDLMESEVKSVEIVWNLKLQRRFFHVPRPLCTLIGETTKQNLVNSVDRTNQDNKLIDFMKRIHDIYLELKWQEYLAQLGIQKLFSRENQNRATWLSFSLALIINGIFIFDYEYRDETDCLKYVGSSVKKIYLADSRTWNKDMSGDHYHEIPCLSELQYGFVGVLNYVQVSVSVFTLVMYLVVMSKPKYDKALGILEGGIDGPILDIPWYTACWHRIKSSWISVAEGFPPGLYYFSYTIMCILIQSYYPPLCAFLLLDIVVKSPTTANVLMAVYKPRKQLTMTILLLVFCVYIFAVIYFFSFRLQFNDDDALEDDCRTLFRCFIVNLNYGMRLSGGSGDNMTHAPETGRVSIDLLYFWVIIVVLLNIVFGIIIDTFAELREGLAQREYQTKKFCFICGISSETFDRNGFKDDDDDDSKSSKSIAGRGGWYSHYHKDHNMWNYAYFMISLKEQDKDDDDGLELYVRRCMDNEDVEWFPKNMALTLKREGTQTEEERMADMLNSVEKKIEDGEKIITAHHDKKSEKLQRTIDALAKNQKDTQNRLDSITQMLLAQTKAVNKLTSHMHRPGSAGSTENYNNQSFQSVGSSGGGGGGSHSPMSSPPAPMISAAAAHAGNRAAGYYHQRASINNSLGPNQMMMEQQPQYYNNNQNILMVNDNQIQQPTPQHPLASPLQANEQQHFARHQPPQIQQPKVQQPLVQPTTVQTPVSRSAWEDRILMEVLDAVDMPPKPGAMGALMARVYWNDDPKGKTETVWLGPKPNWFVGNKFTCARVSSNDKITIQLLRKQQKQKNKQQNKDSSLPNSPDGDVVADLTLSWDDIKTAVLDGDKKYFSLMPFGEYRETAPNCRLGLKFSA